MNSNSREKILAVTRGVFHPSITAQNRLFSILTDSGSLSVVRAYDLEVLESENLKNFRTLVFYLHEKNISTPALNNLKSYVKAGGGLLGIHSVTASFKNEPGYGEIFGGIFTGHDKVKNFTIQQVKTGHSIFKGTPDFEIRDELYHHRFVADVDVQFSTDQSPDQIPVVWTRSYGKGRVCYAAPGHKAATWHIKQMQDIIRRALSWTAGE